MPLYQVQFRKGNRTSTENVEANDYKDVLEYYEALSSAEVLEIREFLFIADKSKLVDNPECCKRSVKLKLKNDLGYVMSFRIPNARAELKRDTLSTYIDNYLEVDGKEVTFEEIVFIK